MDQLSRCLSYVVLVLIILTFFLRNNVIYTVALLGIVYIYFRMFSRNISRRSAENQKYMKIHYKFMSKFNKANPDVAAAIEGKNIVKEIYVKGRIVNIVAK